MNAESAGETGADASAADWDDAARSTRPARPARTADTIRQLAALDDDFMERLERDACGAGRGTSDGADGQETVDGV